MNSFYRCITEGGVERRFVLIVLKNREDVLNNVADYRWFTKGLPLGRTSIRASC
ncbi:hypothetical protein [Neorickettsia sennetsu]|uniref:Uncharacterized protein n=1 Tax=Ehrlichia sennetsu (strain ATCC VR-367 / Miyayama) TaxID=222891 RepID=Q2GF25_EHRS3|nr:hypothetical protein [Neorickettsia sennetsu]ABD46383.1 hypothetical protein NSE_0028 [Neorickettsia sennetsu str. Miyayama]